MSSFLRRLVHLFPPAFRDRFGDGMLEQIDEDLARACARGRISAAWVTVATALDLVRSNIAERVSPTWVTAPQTPPLESHMQSTFNEWMRDLHLAARSLKRSPGFTAVAVGTLGLAIGVNAGMFSVVDTVLLHPLPYANADRLVYIAAIAPGSDIKGEFGVSSEFYIQYKEQSKQLQDVALYNGFTSTFRTPDRVERVLMSAPTLSLFSTLGAKTVLGRTPAAGDENHTAVISYALWQSWFGGDKSIIGRSYEIADSHRTIVGVMAPDFNFPSDGTVVWLSSDVRATDVRPGHFGWDFVGRMVPGATPQTVASELTALAKKLPERFGGSASYARIMEKHVAVVRPLEDQMLGSVARPLWVLLGAVTIVLLIACANVANLFLVRAEGRQRDLAVRRAIGAGRGQLIRSQMAEAIVVAAFAAALAVVLAATTLPIFLEAAPPEVPRLHEIRMNATTLAFTVGAALLAAIACGLMPAIRASTPDLRRLRDGSRGSTRQRSWARDGLVIGQTALALVLLIGSGLLVRSFWSLRHVNPGYTTNDIFTFQIAPDGPDLPDAPAYARFDLNFMDCLRALPGVDLVGLVENIPLDESTSTSRFRSEDRASDSDDGMLINYNFTAGDYFKAMNIHVLRGRTFGTNDHISTLGNVIISKTAANMLWPGQDPVGHRLQHGARSSEWDTVVGMVDDVMQDGFRDTPQPVVYYPLTVPSESTWAISSPAYVVKTRRAATIGPEVRALVHAIAPRAPMYRVFTLDQLVGRSMVDLSFTMLTLGVASALALLLGAVGLYGVLSYIVAQRTREIGVRMALGAEASRVRAMVVAQGARVVGMGVGIGIVVALLSTRALGGLLFGVKALDVPTFIGMSASMLAIGVLASYVPARRASKVDPIESLRGD